jgi:hypothetical protein
VSLPSKSTKFLYFEVARLRTLYDSKPEIKEEIIERYKEIVKELDGRGAKWFWAPHPIDQFVDIRKAFVKPNKPAWRIFTPEEVFGVSGFELPVLVDIKIDGMRLQIHNEGEVKIFSEDEGFNKTSKFKDPLEDIKKLPEGTILDAEGVLVADGQVLHRTSFIGYVNGKGFDEEKDKQTEFWVFDVLKWAGQDLMDEPLSVRLSYLKKVPVSTHLKTFKVGEESFVCKTKEEVLSAIKKVAGKKGSEGAMIKVLSSKYVKDIHNKGWVKLKNLKEVDCLVVEVEQPKHHKGPLGGESVEGVYNYHVAAGPYSEEDGKVLLDKVPFKVKEFEGKVYAYLGKTFNTEIKAKVGNIIRIWSPEINRYSVKETNLFTYGIYEPKVLEWVHERNIPDSLNVLDRLAEETSELHPREAKNFEGDGTKEEKKVESNAMYLPRHSCMLVWSGVKTQIVKEKPFEGMLKKDLFLCDDHYYYGKIVLIKMYEMSRKEVEDQVRQNRVIGEDWNDWKEAKTFYGYDFRFEAVFEPKVVSIPHGAQTFFVLDEGKNTEALGADYSPALIGNQRTKAEGGDWCSSQGGNWITVDGRHLCIGAEHDTLDGKSKTFNIIHNKDHFTRVEFEKGTRQEIKDKIRNAIQYAPQRFKEGLKSVVITRETMTMKEHFTKFGMAMPPEYGKYSNSKLSGYYDPNDKSIHIYGSMGAGSTFQHEFGHHIYANLSGPEKEEWNGIWENNKSSLTEYGRTNVNEGLAEAVNIEKNYQGLEFMIGAAPNSKINGFVEGILKGD